MRIRSGGYTVRLIAVLGFAHLLSESRPQNASAATFTAEMTRLLEQAEKLERAATGCREQVQSGQMLDCRVEVNFQNDRLVSPAAADALAVELRIQAHRLSYSEIQQQNGENNRSTYIYAEIINRFEVATNPLYARSNAATYCNFFVQDVTRAMGAPLPQLLANDTSNWLNDRTKGGAQGWLRLTANEAQRMANSGHPTVAIWSNPGGHGHVAIVRPGSTGDPRGDAEAQAGTRTLNATHITRGFNNQNMAKSIIYWGHN
jgi:hypothetical protein